MKEYIKPGLQVIVGIVLGYFYFKNIAYNAPEFMHAIQAFLNVHFFIVYALFPVLVFAVSLLIKKLYVPATAFFITTILLSILLMNALARLS